MSTSSKITLNNAITFIEEMEDISASYLETDVFSLREDTKKKVIALKTQIDQFVMPHINSDHGKLFLTAFNHKKISVINFLIEQGQVLHVADLDGNIPLHLVLQQIIKTMDVTERIGFHNVLKKIVVRILEDSNLSLKKMFGTENRMGETPKGLMNGSDDETKNHLHQTLQEAQVDMQTLDSESSTSISVAESEDESIEKNVAVVVTYKVGNQTFTLQELIDSYVELESQCLKLNEQLEVITVQQKYDPDLIDAYKESCRRVIDAYKEYYLRDQDLISRLQRNMSLRRGQTQPVSEESTQPTKSKKLPKSKSNRSRPKMTKKSKERHEVMLAEQAASGSGVSDQMDFETLKKNFLQAQSLIAEMRKIIDDLNQKLENKEALAAEMANASEQISRLKAELAESLASKQAASASRGQSIDPNYIERLCHVCKGAKIERPEQARAALEDYVIHQQKPNFCNAEGVSGLHLAAQHGQVEIVIFLVKNGADVNMRDPEGRKPIDMLEANISTEYGEIKTILRSPLIHTLVYQTISKLHGFDEEQEILAGEALKTIPPNFDLEATDSKGWTLMHHAAAANCVLVVLGLALKGADVNAVIPVTGQTPMHLAMTEGSLKKWGRLRATVKALLEEGANPRIKTLHEHTPEALATEVDEKRNPPIERGRSRSNSVGRRIRRSLSRGSRQSKEKNRKSEKPDDSLKTLFVNIKNLKVGEGRLKKQISKSVQLEGLFKMLSEEFSDDDKDWIILKKIYNRYHKVFHIFNPDVDTSDTSTVAEKVFEQDVSYLEGRLSKSFTSPRSYSSSGLLSPRGASQRINNQNIVDQTRAELNEFVELLKEGAVSLHAENFQVSDDNLSSANEQFSTVALRIFFDAISRRDSNSAIFLLNSEKFKCIHSRCIVPDTGQSCLFFAAEQGEIYVLAHLLTGNSDLLNAVDQHGRTIEMIAAIKRNPLIFLIIKRANPDFNLRRNGMLRDEKMNSIFHLAIRETYPSLLKTAMEIAETTQGSQLLFEKNLDQYTPKELLDNMLSKKGLTKAVRDRLDECLSILTRPRTIHLPAKVIEQRSSSTQRIDDDVDYAHASTAQSLTSPRRKNTNHSSLDDDN